MRERGNFGEGNATCNTGIKTRKGNFSVITSDPAMWGPWGDFGDCSVTCGTGTKTRKRSCVPADECPDCTKPRRCKCDGSKKDQMDCEAPTGEKLLNIRFVDFGTTLYLHLPETIIEYCFVPRVVIPARGRANKLYNIFLHFFSSKDHITVFGTGIIVDGRKDIK